MSVLLREVIPDGTQWGQMGEIFPDYDSLSFGQDIVNASSIKFDYPIKGRNYNLLREGMYIVAVINNFYKYKDSYFYIQTTEGGVVPESDDSISVSGVSLKKRLDRVRWAPAIGSVYMDKEMFQYKSKSPTQILQEGISNYKSRAQSQFDSKVNWISNVVSTGFDKFLLDEIVEGGTSIESMIQRYQDLGIATVHFEGFQLTVLNYYGVGDDPVSFNDKREVQLKVGLNLKGGTYGRTNEELTTALLVKGAPDELYDGDEKPEAVAWVTSPQAVIDRFGYHEDILEVNSASDQGTLQAIGKAYLTKKQELRESRTYDMVDNLRDGRGRPIAVPAALIDFQVGDYITVLTTTGATVDRVYAVTISVDNAGLPSIALTLNDYFDEWEVVFNQRLRRLEG